MSGRDGFAELGIGAEPDGEAEAEAELRSEADGREGAAGEETEPADAAATEDAARVGGARDDVDARPASDGEADPVGSAFDLELDEVSDAELDDAPASDIRRSPAVQRRLRARRWRTAGAVFALCAVLAGAGALTARNVAVAGVERNANDAVAARVSELRAAIEAEAAEAAAAPGAPAASGATPSPAAIVADAVVAVERAAGGGATASERLLVLDGAGPHPVGEPRAGEQSAAEAKWDAFAASVAATDAWSGVAPDPDGGSIRWGRAEATIGDSAVSVVAARSTAEERRAADLLALVAGGAGVLAFALLALFSARRGRSLLRVADAFEALDADMNGAAAVPGAGAGAAMDGSGEPDEPRPAPAAPEPAVPAADLREGAVDDDLLPARPDDDAAGPLAFVEQVERDAREAPGAGISIDDLHEGADARASRD